MDTGTGYQSSANTQSSINIKVKQVGRDDINKNKTSQQNYYSSKTPKNIATSTKISANDSRKLKTSQQINFVRQTIIDLCDPQLSFSARKKF